MIAARPSGSPQKRRTKRSEEPAADPALNHPETSLTAAHAIYKHLLSPLLHAATTTFGLTTACRFQPTCSAYATLAFAQHGPARGLWLTTRRLLRCNPFSRGGWDPVPTRRPPS